MSRTSGSRQDTERILYGGSGDQTKTAFVSSVVPSDTTFLLLLGLNFALYAGVFGLRRQIAELKEKLDV